jgi:hypothetical protein
MPQQDWLIKDNGECLPFSSPRQWDLLSSNNTLSTPSVFNRIG